MNEAHITMIINSSVFKWLTLSLLVLAVWSASTAASAHSRIQMVKFPLRAGVEQRERIDSTLRAQPGVFSATWSPRRQMLIVVYDRCMTNRQRLKRVVTAFSTSNACVSEKKTLYLHQHKQ